MSVSRRYFAPDQLQFITSSVYRRLKLFDSYCLHLMFVEVLREYRQERGSADSRISESLRFSPCHEPRLWASIAVAACSQKVDVHHVKSRRL